MVGFGSRTDTQSSRYLSTSSNTLASEGYGTTAKPSNFLVFSWTQISSRYTQSSYLRTSLSSQTFFTFYPVYGSFPRTKIRSLVQYDVNFIRKKGKLKHKLMWVDTNPQCPRIWQLQGSTQIQPMVPSTSAVRCTPLITCFALSHTVDTSHNNTPPTLNSHRHFAAFSHTVAFCPDTDERLTGNANSI